MRKLAGLVDVVCAALPVTGIDRTMGPRRFGGPYGCNTLSKTEATTAVRFMTSLPCAGTYFAAQPMSKTFVAPDRAAAGMANFGSSAVRWTTSSFISRILLSAVATDAGSRCLASLVACKAVRSKRRLSARTSATKTLRATGGATGSSRSSLRARRPVRNINSRSCGYVAVQILRTGPFRDADRYSREPRYQLQRSLNCPSAVK